MVAVGRKPDGVCGHGLAPDVPPLAGAGPCLLAHCHRRGSVNRVTEREIPDDPVLKSPSPGGAVQRGFRRAWRESMLSRANEQDRQVQIQGNCGLGRCCTGDTS